MPKQVNLSDIYSLKDSTDYVADARKEMLVDLIMKYNVSPPESNYKGGETLTDKYKESPKSWSYGNGMLGYSSPILDGELNTNIGLDKLKVAFGNRNNDFDLNIGAGGNHNLKWNGKF